MADPTVIEAEYESECGWCGEEIEVGDEIALHEGEWIHYPVCWEELVEWAH